MKKISLLVLSTILAMSISAQDLGVESIVVKANVDTGWQKITNDTVLLNETVYLGVVFRNYAGTLVNNTDSISFGVSVNGIPIGNLGAIVGKKLIPTAGFNTAEMILKKDQIFSTAIASAKVCAWPIFWSKQNMGGSTANDTGCATYTIWNRVITISNFAPEEGKAGTDITINGSYFGADPASNLVKFNGEIAVIKSATVNTIIATVPGTAVSGNITVEASGKTGTSAEGFVVLDENGNPKDALSLADIQKISSFIGFSNNQLIISTGNTVTDLKIFDLTGKIVSSASGIPSNTMHTQNLSSLQSGVYIATCGSEYFKFSK